MDVGPAQSKSSSLSFSLSTAIAWMPWSALPDQLQKFTYILVPSPMYRSILSFTEVLQEVFFSLFYYRECSCITRALSADELILYPLVEVNYRKTMGLGAHSINYTGNMLYVIIAAWCFSDSIAC